jgi:hypothetical protein
VTIDVTPVVDLFQATPAAAIPGKPLTLSWKTHGANSVTLSLATTGELHSESEAGKVAEGSFDYTVSPDLSDTDVLTFELRAASETSSSVQTVQIYKSGAPQVTRWIVPRYAQAGSSLSVAWTTSQADQVEILRDGKSVYLSPSPDAAVEGTLSFPAPMADQKFQLRAIDSHGGSVLSDELTVSPVGLPDPASSTFTSSDPAIATGGTPVTLTWSVPNARNLEIVDPGVKAVGVAVLTSLPTASSYTFAPGQLAFQGTNALSKRMRFTNATGGTLSPGGTLSLTVVADGVGADFNCAPNTFAATFMQPTLTGVTPTNPVGANGTWLTTWGEDATTVYSGQGPGAESGSVQLYPNRYTEYHLTGDNGAGTTLTPMVASVAVAQPAHLNFSVANVPSGAIVQLTGPNVPGAGALEPLNFAAQNLSTQSYVDISSTGTEINFPTPLSDFSGVLVNLPQPFQTNWRGNPVGGSSLTVNFQGWMAFSKTLVNPTRSTMSGSLTGLPVMRGGVALLDAQGIYQLKRGANSHVYWQLDAPGGQQRLIVQWTDIGASTNAALLYSFQAQLYATGEVVLAYAKVPAITSVSQSPWIGVYAGDDATTWVSPSAGQMRNVKLPMPGDRFGLFTKLPASYDYVAAPENLRVSMDMGNNHRMVIQDSESVVPPNQVTLTEAMMNPPTGSTNGEWIEFNNTTATDFDLNGWDLEFGGSSRYTFTSSVKVPANGFLVLGQSATAPAASAVNYFSYGPQYTLPKNGAPLNLTRSKGVYTSLGLGPTGLVGTVMPGYSIQLGGKVTGWTYPTGVTTTVCTAPTASTFGTGLYGTPGTANPNCPTYATKATIAGSFELLAGQTGTTQLTPGNNDNDIVQLNLTAPARFGALSYSKVYVGTNGYVSLEPLTCAADTTGTCFATNPSSLSGVLPPVGVVAPFWMDLTVGQGGIYTARRTGYTIVSWENVTLAKPGVGETYSLNFQVKFFDTGNIEFHYGTMTGTGSTSATNNAKGYSATSWLQTPQGGAMNSVNLPFGTAIAPNSAYRFTAQ